MATILIVEDDENMQLLMSERLEDKFGVLKPQTALKR